MSLTREGQSAIFSTTGNSDCHVILRGGKKPNYDAESVQAAAEQIGLSGQTARFMIDCSHANSGKNHIQQETVCHDIAQQLSEGENRIMGLMLESNLVAGRQNQEPGKKLVYGQSITDACMAWGNTEPLLYELAQAVRERRQHQTK
jgi:3-deoxy-7-phosphoheptulonate synthase